MVAHKLRRGKGRAGAGGSTLDASDVFSTYLYTGNGTTQTITNGIDLAGKGGLVWIKDRTAANPAWLYDTNRGTSSGLQTSNTSAAFAVSTAVTAFNSNGFSLGTNGNSNTNTNNYASWTFRKAPKFFDIVTYTGNGVAGRQIPHSLGATPGMIIVKKTSDTGSWAVYHKSVGATKYLSLQTTSAPLTYIGTWNNTEPTSGYFILGDDTNVNLSGATYVAYLFAHDTDAD